MIKLDTVFALVLSIFILPNVSLADFNLGRVDSHAPIGVMADHIHKKNELMLSYKYMFMEMDGNRDGTRSLSTADVLADFPVSPTDMDMEMHMIGIMFAPNDRLTLMGMIPYTLISMNHETRMGRKF